MLELNKRPIAVFFDRDGTINEEAGYLSNPEDLSLIKGAAEAVKRLNTLGIKVIVISNQSGVGRGYFSEEDLARVNRRLTELLSYSGARIDAIYYCPHHPEDNCECRKPRPGLLKKAAMEHSVDLGRSYVVGDKNSDVELAGNAGAKGILVKTGFGTSQLITMAIAPVFVADDILDATMWIINDLT
jgi:D-glycero-D-manno-heptose 1,7-bisphosphate phosphatase